MEDHDPDLDEPLPHLTADMDDEELAAVVDTAILAVVKNDAEIASLHHELLFQQQALQAVFPEAFPQFLVIEAAANARFGELALRLVRWAFTEGALHGRRHGAGP